MRKLKGHLRTVTDIAMMFLLPALMAYLLVGETAHEWLGIAVMVLFVLHHILNFKWHKNLSKGKYTAARIIMTAVDILLVMIIIALAVSGVMLSRHIFAGISSGGTGTARTVHLLASYWGFLLMSVHIGFHLNSISGRIHKEVKFTVRVALTALSVLVSIYGIHAFGKRQIGSYLFLKNQFVFFDFTEPRILFFIDYAAIMFLFAFIGHLVFVNFLKLPNGIKVSFRGLLRMGKKRIWRNDR